MRSDRSMLQADKMYDHYKDTNRRQDAARKDRDRFFLVSLLLVFLLALFAYDPVKSTEVANAALQKYGLDVSLSGRVFQTMFWCGMLYAFIRYLQASVTVERQYLYLDKIEKELRDYDMPVSREGIAYSKDWPCVSHCIDWLYKYFFIAVFNVVLVVKIVTEASSPDVFVAIDVLVLVAFVVLSIMYWWFLYKMNREGKDA